MTVVAQIDIFVARQPILNARGDTVAYELLFRAAKGDSEALFEDGNSATAQVIANSLMSIGFDRVLGGKRGFINFTRDLILQDVAYLLPKDSVVIELLESIEATGEVIEKCAQLKGDGYLLALDDFVFSQATEPFTQFGDYIKVDFRSTSIEEQAALGARYASSGVQLLAEKVETKEEFERARKFGYTLFQGYYFALPEIVAGREVAGLKTSYVRLFEELSRDELRFDNIDAILKREVSLSYKLLRYLNSAMFHFARPVSSIRQALTLIGEQEIRRWLLVAAMSMLVGDRPAELVTASLTRARFCELLAPLAGMTDASDDLFFAGLLSGLEGVVGRPLASIMEELAVNAEVKAALLGNAGPSNRLARVYAAARAYESADWDALRQVAGESHMALEPISPAYVEAAAWADQVFAC